jgi:O-antigen/teichoic acid export membrane protein
MPDPAGSAPLGARLFAGAALMVGLRFAVRARGLVSVIILARLLTPTDFGVIGTAA